MNRILIILILTLTGLATIAQSERSLVRKGNEDYKKGNYQRAIAKYKQASDKNKQLYQADFNTGDALYKQNKYEESEKYFDYLSKQDIPKQDKAKAYHNLGNSYLKQNKNQEAINAYKQSLINNSKDDDTKFNLAYAQQRLQKQQQQKKKDNKDNKDKKDDKKDQKKDDKKNQDDKKDQKKQDPKQQQQPKPGDISKEDAERMLQAVEKNEKETQDKLKKLHAKSNVKIEKDW